MTYLFIGTTIGRSKGGIASSNKNLLKAITELSMENNADYKAFFLHESESHHRSIRCFNGNKFGLAKCLLVESLRSSLVIFDHVNLAYPILFLPKFIRPKIIIFGHGSEVGKRIKSRSRVLLKEADLVMVNSRFTLKNLRRTLKDPSVGMVCELGLSYDVSHERGLVAGNKSKTYNSPFHLVAADGCKRKLMSRVILIVSRLDKSENEKGHNELIDSMKFVVESCKDAQLVIVGSGSNQEHLVQRAMKSGVSSNIFFTGTVTDAMLDMLYSLAYLFAMPSRQEGFGLVYIEAMARSLPCIACRGDGAETVVRHLENGLLVDQPLRVNDLAIALCMLLNNEHLATSLGREGHDMVVKTYTAAEAIKRLKKAISPIISRCD